MTRTLMINSYDPLYPSKVLMPISSSIYELFQIDLQNYAMHMHGKAAMWQYLEYRYEKMYSWHQTLILIAVFFLVMGTLAIVISLYDIWIALNTFEDDPSFSDSDHPRPRMRHPGEDF